MPEVFATKRFPLESKASPVGCEIPVAKVLVVPEEVTLRMLPLPKSETKKLSAEATIGASPIRRNKTRLRVPDFI
ncbi:MAG TPA: hypothetical protein VL527_17540 [Dongiaceae bacterium]|nr:hypothetical protein [Dongiaceae bacterium]